MLFGIGLAIGPVLGGWLIGQFGWPSVFWYRAPIAFTALALAVLLPADIVERKGAVNFDFAGAAWMVLMLSGYIAMLTLARQAHPVWALLAATIFTVSTWFFVKQELRSAEPVVHVRYYGDRAFAGIQFATLAINFFNFTIFLLAPYLLTERASLVAAGLMLGLYPLGQIAAGTMGTRLSKAVTSLTLVRAGLFIAAAGVAATGFATDAPLAFAGLTLFVAGFGIGTFQVGNIDLTTTILPLNARGVAGSLVNVARLLGIVTGAAIITWIFDALARPDRLQQYRDTFLLMGALQLACAVALSLTVFRTKEKQT